MLFGLIFPRVGSSEEGGYFLQAEPVLKDPFSLSRGTPDCVFHCFRRTNTQPFTAAEVHLRVDDVEEEGGGGGGVTGRDLKRGGRRQVNPLSPEGPEMNRAGPAGGPASGPVGNHLLQTNGV